MEATKFDILSVEDYLAGEKSSEVRHEYLEGVVYAMSGASRNHNVISLNIAAALREALRGGPCSVFHVDLKVHISSQTGDLFYYPDVVVTCDPEDNDPYIVEKPNLVFEVLSESTERIDRREKLFAYQSLGSLWNYVMVAQDRIFVENYSRVAPDAGWRREVKDSPGDSLALPSLDISLPLETIFDGVDFGG